MRDARKNQVSIYYALRNVSAEADEWGNTVDITTYGDPVNIYINVSASKGEAEAQVFGADIQYDRTMTICDMNCPIDEYSHLWLDGRDIHDTHNYEVAAVSKSLNSIKYAIRRVNLSSLT